MVPVCDLKATFSTVFRYNVQPEAGNDVISDVIVGNVGMDVSVKFGDSWSNGFLDFNGAGFVSNERTSERTYTTKPIAMERNAFQALMTRVKHNYT